MMAATPMLRAVLLVLCFAVVAQGQCLAQCLALPCEETHAIHEGAEHTSSARTRLGNCHGAGYGGSGSNPAAPEPSEPSDNEDCGNHPSWRTVSASRLEKITTKTSKFAASLERLPLETDIASRGLLREQSVSLTNPLLPHVRSTVLLI